MPGFHVVIIGHVDPQKRPVDFPEKIYQVFNYDVEHPKQLSNIPDDKIGDIVGCGFMKVRLDPFKVDTTILEPWIAVPLHMLTHLSHLIKPITGELPIFKDGKLQLKSGKEVVKH